MGKQINLLKSLPRTIRTKKMLEERKKTKQWGDDKISRLFGYDYFDGARRYGYNGYHYDGRWVQVAKDIIKHYDLNPGAKVLDIGCAKGYLVYDLLGQGMEAYGVDISKYACRHSPTDIVGHIHYGDILSLHFPDNSFDLVLSINCLHNIEPKLVYLAFNEINRVAKKDIFITVDSYYNEKQRQEFEEWCLTAKTYGTPSFWLDIFEQNNYTKDYDFTVWSSGLEDND